MKNKKSGSILIYIVVYVACFALSSGIYGAYYASFNNESIIEKLIIPILLALILSFFSAALALKGSKVNMKQGANISIIISIFFSIGLFASFKETAKYTDLLGLITLAFMTIFGFLFAYVIFFKNLIFRIFSPHKVISQPSPDDIIDL